MILDIPQPTEPIYQYSEQQISEIATRYYLMGYAAACIDVGGQPMWIVEDMGTDAHYKLICYMDFPMPDPEEESEDESR